MQRKTDASETLSESQQLGFAALASRGLDIPMDQAARTRWQDNFNQIPAMGYMGCRLDLSHPRVVRVYLPEVLPHHQGGMGTEAVNGAVIAGLCDCALGVAGVIQFPGERAGTVELAVKFMANAGTIDHCVFGCAKTRRQRGVRGDRALQRGTLVFDRNRNGFESDFVIPWPDSSA